jgi:hypothetical protein
LREETSAESENADEASDHQAEPPWTANSEDCRLWGLPTMGTADYALVALEAGSNGFGWLLLGRIGLHAVER